VTGVTVKKRGETAEVWKTCGRSVHKLLMRRQRKLFSIDRRQNRRGARETRRLRMSLRLIAGNAQVKFVSLPRI
jgi:hypothetical protein